MISYGLTLTNMAEELISKPVEELYRQIKTPDDQFKQKISQLRMVYQIDKKAYSNLKRQLPYFVCAKFIPSFRKNDNFAFTDYFIVDIDHVSQKELSMQELREKIQADSRVVLSFISPSEDGLKVMFRLQDRCLDKNVYSLFYKTFVLAFSQQYHLDKVVDTVTSDVSRACFLSYDPDVYYNPFADFVDMKKYVSTDNVMDFANEQRKVEVVIKEQKKAENVVDTVKDNTSETADPDSQTLDGIKEKLGLLSKRAQARQRNVYVPEQLEDIMDKVQTAIAETGVVVKSVKDIYYGKQIMFQVGMKIAEINVFYSPKRNDFSTVASTRSGTDLELNEMLKDAVLSIINNIKYGI